MTKIFQTANQFGEISNNTMSDAQGQVFSNELQAKVNAILAALVVVS